MFHLQSQCSPETHLHPVRSPFALRNRMTERTSHLVGLWIGAAISNTSHSNNAGSTTVKCARLTGKGTKVDGSVAIISIKNFPIGLHVMYLYFLDIYHASQFPVPHRNLNTAVSIPYPLHYIIPYSRRLPSSFSTPWEHQSLIC
jgi:hypothetical protein